MKFFIEGLGTAIGASYRTSWDLVKSAAWLWAGVAAFELLQHGVEWNLGIYAPDGHIEAATESRAFWIAAYAKVAAVAACSYLVPRYLFQGRTRPQVLRVDGTLLRGIAVVAGTFALSLGIPEALTSTAKALDLMDPSTAAIWGQLIGFVLFIPLMAVVPWGIGLVAGDRSMTLRKSIHAMRRRWIWAVLLVLCCSLPLLIAHFALNELTFGAPAALSGSLLFLDAIWVGYMALLLGCVNWTLYRIRVLEALASIARIFLSSVQGGQWGRGPLRLKVRLHQRSGGT